MTKGDRVMITGRHPWAGHAGTLIACEKYGLGWLGWRIVLDGNCGECYAKEEEMIAPRVDSIRYTMKTSRKKRSK